MERHTGLVLQSHWHSVGLTLGCPHLAPVMGTPSGQYVHLKNSACSFIDVSFMSSICRLFHSQFNLFFIHYVLINLFCFFLPPPPSPLSFPSPHHLHVCACVNWKIPVGQIIVPPFFPTSLFLSLPLSLSLSLSLSGRLQRNWSLGGSREEPGKGGTKGRPSAAITTPHLLSPPPPLRSSLPRSPRLSSLSPLASAPN